MAAETKIEWADSTLNIWEGCQETGSKACLGCYARERNLRYAPKGSTVAPNWGPRAPRREVKSWRSTLRKISRVAKAAFDAGRTEPWFVFVNSLSDFWDNQADPKLRAEALEAFELHPHLTFLLLTKRPQNIVKMVQKMAEADMGPYADDIGVLGWWPPNVAIGCTVVTQAEANRDVPHLLRAAASLNPAFVFLSIEPMQEAINLRKLEVERWGTMTDDDNWAMDALEGRVAPIMLLGMGDWELDGGGRIGPKVDWVITGGETDQGEHMSRAHNPQWFRDLRDQCADAGVAYQHKQNGEWCEFGERGLLADGSMNFLGRPDDVATGKRVYFGDTIMQKVGKAKAGRLLDGVEHNDRPVPRAA